MSEAKRLSEAQRRALESAVRTGNPAAHIDGQLAWCGWGGTRASLQRAGLLNEACQITPAGRLALNPPTQSHLAGKGEL